MNKNTIIGFVLIGLILIGFSWYNSKIFREQERARFVQDSIAAEQAMQAARIEAEKAAELAAAGADSGKTVVVEESFYKDSLLAVASSGTESFSTLENEKVRITYSNKGAQPYSVQIKDYTKWDGSDLMLVKPGAGNFNIQFYTNQLFNTSDLYFSKVSSTDSSVVYRLAVAENAYVEYSYVLPKDTYLVDFDMKLVGMDRYIPKNVRFFDMTWNLDIPRLEKGYDNEKNYSTVVYKYPNESSVEDLGLRKDSAEEDIKTKLSWFAFQQQFFSAIMVSENSFAEGDLSYKFYPENDEDRNLMACEARMVIPYDPAADQNYPFKFYFGPNLYKELKSYDMGFEKIVPLGWGIIGWINRFFIIPFFDLLGRFISDFGLIILLMTIAIKLIISPLTLKSYLSTAKMRVLKPEVDKINAKYPKQEDAMKKQQEIMALYQKTGVSMFGGCLPMLLQFPILFAMFRFFPASFELRQKGFLWADDLSAYDSILDLPFHIPLYGDHVSLFAILMALSMYFYTRINMKDMPSGQDMAGMKFMQVYFMPIFMLVLCNNFSSGLSYYYMLSNLITIGQTWVIRKYFVDEEKIFAKLKEKAASGKVKKSRFQQRLEEMQKQQEMLRKQQDAARKGRK